MKPPPNKPDDTHTTVVSPASADISSGESPALNAQCTQSLLRLNQMKESTLQEITDFALEESVRLTQSMVGYLAFLNNDESVLTMHSWSKSAMKECAIIDKPIVYQVKDTGLWGEAVRQRQPVITNDYSAPNPLIKGQVITPSTWSHAANLLKSM